MAEEVFIFRLVSFFSNLRNGEEDPQFQNSWKLQILFEYLNLNWKQLQLLQIDSFFLKWLSSEKYVNLIETNKLNNLSTIKLANVRTPNNWVE